MPEITAKELENKTLEELAVLGERNHPMSAEGILIKNELQKRRNLPPERNKQWYEKPSGILLIGIVASLLSGALWYFYGPR